MNKALLGAVAAVAFGATAFVGSAQAQCVWTGLNWSCPGPVAIAPVGSDRLWAAPPWQTYPTTGYEYNGYKPQWLPSYPGPRASSGAGR